jgi:predicted acetyltransferase
MAREFRRRGIGGQAIRVLADEVWPADKQIRVNVLIENRPALAFWRAVGFEDYLLARDGAVRLISWRSRPPWNPVRLPTAL